MCSIQTQNLTQMCPFNHLDLSQINLIHAREFSFAAIMRFLGGIFDFWPKFCDGGH